MKKLLLAAFFLLTASFSPVTADPVVIWSGSGSDITNTGGAFQWDLRNSDGSVVINFISNATPGTNNPISPASFAFPGQPLNLNFAGAGNDVHGTVTVNGVTHPALGTLLITASVLTPLTGLPGEIHLFTPFTFTGAVCTTESPGCPLTLQLVGRGIVDATVEFNPGTGWYLVRHVTYTFETPEPVSLILFGSGLLGMSGVALRRRPGSRSRRKT